MHRHPRRPVDQPPRRPADVLTQSPFLRLAGAVGGYVRAMALHDGPLPPSDGTTLSDVLEAYAASGYKGEFRVLDGGVRCGACGGVSPVERFELESIRRLEGASDPADMSAVLATACPACGTRGTVVVMFGPEASEGEAQLLRRSRDRRFDGGTLPSASAPDPRPAS
jgi:hypothetical protein